jgi:hypothetical protein
VRYLRKVGILKPPKLKTSWSQKLFEKKC